MKTTLVLAVPVALLAACSGMSSPMKSSSMTAPMSTYSQANLPSAVQVPSGNKVAMETVGVGEITYQCREKQGAAGTYEWVFAGPKAALNSRSGTKVGTYYGPPATWEANDGSKITATQVAVSPGGNGNIPLQLVKANPAMGKGSMTGVTYVQRVATRGGVAPAMPCTAANVGSQEIVKYQADYIFWSAT